MFDACRTCYHINQLNGIDIFNNYKCYYTRINHNRNVYLKCIRQ